MKQVATSKKLRMNQVTTSKKLRPSNLRIRILSVIMGALILQVISIFSPLKPLALIRDAEGIGTEKTVISYQLSAISKDSIQQPVSGNSGKLKTDNFELITSSNKWEVQCPAMNANWLNDIWADSDHNAFAVGFGMNGAVIGHYDGQTWKTMESYIMGEAIGGLTGIWAGSGKDIFAVGGTIGQSEVVTNDPGRTMILHYNGTAWSIMDANFPGCLLDVWGSGPNDVFAVGREGLILHWNGSTWSKTDITSRVNPANSVPDLQGLWGDGPNNVFCLGVCVSLSSSQTPITTVLHYQNGVWTEVNEIPSVLLYDIWGTTGGDIWAVGDHIYVCQDWAWGAGNGGTGGQGGTWLDATPAELVQKIFYLNEIAARSGNDIMAVGVVIPDDPSDPYASKGLRMRYDGQSWKKVEDAQVAGCLSSVWVGQGNKAMVVGGNYQYEYPSEGIFMVYDGVSWFDRSAKAYEGMYLQVWANSSQDIYAVGGHPDPMNEELAKARIEHYDGQQWTAIDVPGDGILFDIWGCPAGGGGTELFAVGGGTTQILHSSNGKVWAKMSGTQGLTDVFTGVWGTSASDVFAVGDSIYHYNGTKWSKMTVPSSTGILNDVWGSNSSNVFAVGFCLDDTGSAAQRKATILRYNGQSWTSMSHTIQGNLLKVWGTSPSNVYALGEEIADNTSGGGNINYYARIYHYDGAKWADMNCPDMDGFDDIWGTSATNVFVAYEMFSQTPSENDTSENYSFQCGVLHYDGQTWTDMGVIPACGPIWGIRGIASSSGAGTSAASGGGAGSYGLSDLFVVGDIGSIARMKSNGGTEQKIYLQQGWNLISFQADVCFYKGAQPPDNVQLWGPADIEFRQVQDLKAYLSDRAASPIRDAADLQQAGDWRRITSFDQTGAHIIDKNMASSANTLDYLAAGYGYWIKMNRPGYFVVSGKEMSPSTQVHLQTGWNLIGPISSNACYYHDSQPACLAQETPPVNFVATSGPAVAAALPSLTGKYTRVTGFDCTGAMLYDTKAQSYACTLTYCGPGYGYWVKMTQEGDLTLH